MDRRAWICAAALLVALAWMVAVSVIAEGQPGERAAKSVLVLYHGGKLPWQGSAPLEAEVDALTQATTQPINVESVAENIREALTAQGYRVELKKAMDVHGPKELLGYDGIIFGTPTWFSNMAWPVKKVFDEYLIRIYEHREGKLNDKVLSGFVTVMEKGESGPRCLQCLTWGLAHLSGRIAEGVVINVFESREEAQAKVEQFCERFAEALGN